MSKENIALGIYLETPGGGMHNTYCTFLFKFETIVTDLEAYLAGCLHVNRKKTNKKNKQT